MPIPLNLPNFLNAPILSGRNEQAGNMFSGAVGAYQEGQKNRQSLLNKEQERQAQLMKNAILEKHGMREAELKNKMLEAQAYHHMQAGKHAGIGSLSDIGKTVRDISDIRSGGDDQKIKDMESLLFARTTGKFAPSGVQKLNNEMQEVDQGFMPGTNGTVQLTPDQQERLKGQYELKIQKDTTDSLVRSRALNANNLLKAFERTSIDDLVTYSGPKGHVDLARDMALDAMGKAPERYKKHKIAEANAKIEAKELGQMLGASVRTEERKYIETLLNPSNTYTSAKIAKAQLTAMREVLKKQAETFTKGLKSIKPYEEYESESEPKIPFNELTTEQIKQLRQQELLKQQNRMQ